MPHDIFVPLGMVDPDVRNSTTADAPERTMADHVDRNPVPHLLPPNRPKATELHTIAQNCTLSTPFFLASHNQEDRKNS